MRPNDLIVACCVAVGSFVILSVLHAFSLITTKGSFHSLFTWSYHEIMELRADEATFLRTWVSTLASQLIAVPPMLVWASLCPETPKLRWSRPFLVCQLVNAIWSGMRIRALWELDSLVLSLNQSPEETMTHRLMLLGFGVIGTLRFVVSCLWIETFWVANRLVHFCQALIMILSIIALWWLDSPVIILGNPELKGRDVVLPYLMCILCQFGYAAFFNPANRKRVAKACRAAFGVRQGLPAISAKQAEAAYTRNALPRAG